ncbi:hypothetical protein OG921_13000 [Aldersonia sp. NBC_00410]|uniref:hypothetical protein n=1 Tax=Aldersonia sp. NBC_00410 TaxID=2975954 RepID=UPI002255AB95|nr:hypothetical protein [Aldersonia sp. NBC_00410]MCX5044083.1 hypothetical protein [Aldersonia sp. NBC_00410]
MTKNEWIVDPQRVVETTQVGMTALSSEDVALLQTLIGEHVQSGPTPASRDLIPHIAEHVGYVLPALIADPRAADCLRQLNAAFGVIDIPPETGQDLTPLAAVSGNDTHDGSTDGSPDPAVIPWGPIALGVGAAAITFYITAEAIYQYCTDVHPEPGESASLRC